MELMSSWLLWIVLPSTLISCPSNIHSQLIKLQELFTALGTKLLHSTAYHPQTDGQTERINQCLEMYLRCAVQQSPQQWKKWLPLAELWYNSTFHTALGCSPFKALYGYDSNMGVLPSQTDPPPTEQTVQEMLSDREEHIAMLKNQLAVAQNRMKLQADTKRF